MVDAPPRLLRSRPSLSLRAVLVFVPVILGKLELLHRREQGPVLVQSHAHFVYILATVYSLLVNLKTQLRFPQKT